MWSFITINLLMPTFISLIAKEAGINVERGCKSSWIINKAVGINMEGRIFLEKKYITALNKKWRVEKNIKINKRVSTFIREMRVIMKNILGIVFWIRIHKGVEPIVVCSTFLFLVPRSKKGHNYLPGIWYYLILIN